MKKLFQSWIVRGLALLLAASAAFAQDRVPFRQAELDQMLAPVALYSDSLLSHVLMASTYPLEVVQASRWSRANPNLKGQEAVRAVENMDWDPSVKSLTAFPQVLTMMDERIDWTERLGEAFLAQQADVMDTVQGLRRRAEAAGNLQSSDQMRVAREGDVINIHQPAPEVVYVPYYHPAVVYGTWWWPAYPPVYWAPPRAYYVVPAHRPAFLWGSGIVISAGFFFGHANWHQRHVTVVNNHVTVNRTTVVNRPHQPVVWEHNPAHRRGVPFRHPEARQRYEQSRVSADARRDAGRSDIARTERRADDNRTADNRQHRLDERRNAPQERRADKRDDRRESANNRNDDNDRGKVAVNPNNDRAKSTVQPESRQTQREARGTQPDRNVRPERSAPQANDRRGERSEHRDAPRPQTRSADSRPAVLAPVVRPNAPPAAVAPTVRAQPRPEPRPAAPVASTHASPRQAFEGNRRAEARNDDRGRQRNTVRENASVPRPTVSGSGRVPQAVSGDHRGGGGAQRQQSMGERIR